MLGWPDGDKPGKKRRKIISRSKRRNVFLRSDSRCHWCRIILTEETFTIEHIVRKADGGTNSYRNLTIACLRCNTSRHGKNFSTKAGIILTQGAPVSTKPRDILNNVLQLPPGGKITIAFVSAAARTGFKRKLAAYRGVVKRKSYAIDPMDPAYGVSPYDGIETQDVSDATLEIFNRPSSEDLGILSIKES